jgi:CRISPR/Cas system-associated exonuclease Cas4 (RecB family)
MVMRFKVGASGNDTKLKQIVDKQTHLVNEERRAGKVRTSLYASDYGSCPRKVYFQFFPNEYAAEKPDARQLRIFQNGDKVHERLGHYLKREESLDFHDEIDVPRDELDVHGRCDGTCTVDEQAVVVEFKSINKDFVDRSKEEHQGQLMWYIHMFKQLRVRVKQRLGLGEFDVVPEDVAADLLVDEAYTRVEKWLALTQGEIRGEIIYESKGNNETFHFVLDYDADKAQLIKDWFAKVKEHVEKKEIPNVRYDPGYFPCSWSGKSGAGRCPYFNICYGENKTI